MELIRQKCSEIKDTTLETWCDSLINRSCLSLTHVKNPDQWIISQGKSGFIMTFNGQYVIVSKQENEILDALTLLINEKKPKKNSEAVFLSKLVPFAGKY